MIQRFASQLLFKFDIIEARILRWAITSKEFQLQFFFCSIPYVFLKRPLLHNFLPIPNDLSTSPQKKLHPSICSNSAASISITRNRLWNSGTFSAPVINSWRESSPSSLRSTSLNLGGFCTNPPLRIFTWAYIDPYYWVDDHPPWK